MSETCIRIEVDGKWISACIRCAELKGATAIFDKDVLETEHGQQILDAFKKNFRNEYSASLGATIFYERKEDAA